MEIKKNQEDLTITPEKELEYVMDGVNEENWGEVTDCLTQFGVKVKEVGLSATDRENLKPKLDEIKNVLSSKNVPDEYKSQIETWLQRAEDAL